MINWTISGIVLGLSAAGMLWTRSRELKEFNGGKCQTCNNQLESIAAHSSSGTLWACSNKKCENSSIENSFWTTWVKEKHKE